MSLIVDEKKRNRWSAVFVSSLLIFSLVCFGLMNTRYDALSRYPYTDRRSRELIKQYLTKQEIDYIIEYSIAPNMFVAYIREDGIWVLTDGTLFDPAFYAASDPEVVKAFGNDPNALLQHYLLFGRYENRPTYLSEEVRAQQELEAKQALLQKPGL